MRKFKSHTLKEYLDALSAREPVPGGGSAASLVGALGAGLISMVANYSLGKGKPPAVEKKIKALLKDSERIRREFLEFVDRDAEAYLRVVRARKSAPHIKKAAKVQAARVPLEICKLCYEAVDLTVYLTKEGNCYLLSDLEAAVEMLLAAHSSAKKFFNQDR